MVKGVQFPQLTFGANHLDTVLSYYRAHPFYLKRGPMNRFIAAREFYLKGKQNKNLNNAELLQLSKQINSRP